MRMISKSQKKIGGKLKLRKKIFNRILKRKNGKNHIKDLIRIINYKCFLQQKSLKIKIKKIKRDKQNFQKKQIKFQI